MSMADKFIQRAIKPKHKGSLRRWALKHGYIQKNGNIDLGRARKSAKRSGDTHRLREINLAITLRRLHR